MTVGERIKKRRKELGINADAIADALGVSRSTVFRYEKGDIEKLPVDVLEPIASILRTTPAYLMGWEDDPTDYDDPDIVADNAGDLLDALDGDVRAVMAIRQAIDQDALNEACAASSTDTIKGLLETVQQLCNSKNISTARLERELDLSNGSVRKWNKAAPSADRLARVAHYFNVSTDYLLGRTENPSPVNEIIAASSPDPNFYENLTDAGRKELDDYKEYLKMKYGKK